MQESTVTQKGQTTLPKPVRDALGLHAGDRLRYVVEGGEVRILKVRSVMELEGLLGDAARPAASLEEMEEGVAAGATRAE